MNVKSKQKAVGWRVATRPGVKQFLANLSRYYEVVIYTTQPGYVGSFFK